VAELLVDTASLHRPSSRRGGAEGWPQPTSLLGDQPSRVVRWQLGVGPDDASARPVPRDFRRSIDLPSEASHPARDGIRLPDALIARDRPRAWSWSSQRETSGTLRRSPACGCVRRTEAARGRRASLEPARGPGPPGPPRQDPSRPSRRRSSAVTPEPSRRVPENGPVVDPVLAARGASGLQDRIVGASEGGAAFRASRAPRSSSR